MFKSTKNIYFMIVFCLFIFSGIKPANAEDVYIQVNGKIVEINEHILETADIYWENDEVLISVRPLFERLNIHLSWDKENQTIIGTKDNRQFKMQLNNSLVTSNGIDKKITVPPKIINGTIVVPVSVVAEIMDASLSKKKYDIAQFSHVISPYEVQLRNHYSNIRNKFATANENYEKTLAQHPSFLIHGDLHQGNPNFLVWGTAFSTNAPLNHPGFATVNSNIAIENPDYSKIMYNKYVGGEHYFKGLGTGKGAFGQSVPIYIFGGPPHELGQKLANLNSAKNELDKAKKDISDFIDNYYLAQVKSNKTNPDQIYANYSIALVQLAYLFNDNNYIAKAEEQTNKFINRHNLAAFAIYLTDSLGFNDKFKSYLAIAENDPYVLLNIVKTPEQHYYAGLALRKLDNEHDKAIFALRIASKSNDPSIQKSSSEVIQQIQSNTDLLSATLIKKINSNKVYSNEEFNFSLEMPEEWLGKYFVEESNHFNNYEDVIKTLTVSYVYDGKDFEMFNIVILRLTEDEWRKSEYKNYWNYLSTDTSIVFNEKTFAYVKPNKVDPNMLNPYDLSVYQYIDDVIEKDVDLLMNSFFLESNADTNSDSSSNKSSNILDRGK